MPDWMSWYRLLRTRQASLESLIRCTEGALRRCDILLRSHNLGSQLLFLRPRRLLKLCLEFLYDRFC